MINANSKRHKNFCCKAYSHYALVQMYNSECSDIKKQKIIEYFYTSYLPLFKSKASHYNRFINDRACDEEDLCSYYCELLYQCLDSLKDKDIGNIEEFRLGGVLSLYIDSYSKVLTNCKKYLGRNFMPLSIEIIDTRGVIIRRENENKKIHSILNNFKENECSKIEKRIISCFQSGMGSVEISKKVGLKKAANLTKFKKRFRRDLKPIIKSEIDYRK